MLYFVSAELALGYWLFAFLCALGALQWVAARYRLGGLSFLDYSRWSGEALTGPLPPKRGYGVPTPKRGYGVPRTTDCWSQSRRWGAALAILLVVGGTVGFFVTQWEAIFAPGPAGSELAVLFATSAACALVVTVAVATFLQHWRQGYTALDVGRNAQPVAVGHATGYVYAPAAPTALAPAVCLLPAYPTNAGRRYYVSPPRGRGRYCISPSVGRGSNGKTGGTHAMVPLARRLVEEGVVVLLIQPDEQAYAYPASLAILPAAVAVLSKRPEVDAGRIGALGEDLGADLVIRAASTSKEIKAVAALAPILADVPVGLDLLCEMSYFRALRWARDRKRANLRKDLNAVQYGARIPPRPFLVLYGEQDRLVGDAWNLLHQSKEAHDSAPPKAIALGATRATCGYPLFGVGETRSSGGTDAERLARESGIEVQVIPETGHFHLAEHPLALQSISQWLKEHL